MLTKSLHWLIVLYIFRLHQYWNCNNNDNLSREISKEFCVTSGILVERSRSLFRRLMHAFHSQYIRRWNPSGLRTIKNRNFRLSTCRHYSNYEETYRVHREAKKIHFVFDAIIHRCASVCCLLINAYVYSRTNGTFGVYVRTTKQRATRAERNLYAYTRLKSTQHMKHE